MRKYTVASLFSGAGGFDWGFHRTGLFSTVLACEKLPQPTATLSYNLELPVYSVPCKPLAADGPILIQGDIGKVDFSAYGFSPDVLIGGPPCQDFSVVVNKKDQERPGLNSGRGQLYLHFVRAIMFLQPKIFVFENVPGLMSANHGQAYRVIWDDLQHLEDRRSQAQKAGNPHFGPEDPIYGYELLFSDVISATNLGVPQNRHRLIIIGVRRDVRESLPTAQWERWKQRVGLHLHGGNSTFATFPLTVLEVLEGEPLPALDKKYRRIMNAYKGIWREPRLKHASEWRERVWKSLTLDIREDYFAANEIERNVRNLIDYEHAMYDHEQLLAELDFLHRPVHKQVCSDTSNGAPRLSQNVMDRMYWIPPDENYAFVDDSPWQVVGKGISLIYRRSAPLKPARTVMAYGGGGTHGYHYERNRAAFTLRERARIQTFSDDFKFQADGVRAQIGEAVPPLMGQRIAELLAEFLADVG